MQRKGGTSLRRLARGTPNFEKNLGEKFRYFRDIPLGGRLIYGYDGGYLSFGRP